MGRNKTATKAPRTSAKWCECGLKRRGKNHDEGEHHKRRMAAKK